MFHSDLFQSDMCSTLKLGHYLHNVKFIRHNQLITRPKYIWETQNDTLQLPNLKCILKGPLKVLK